MLNKGNMVRVCDKCQVVDADNSTQFADKVIFHTPENPLSLEICKKKCLDIKDKCEGIVYWSGKVLKCVLKAKVKMYKTYTNTSDTYYPPTVYKKGVSLK